MAAIELSDVTFTYTGAAAPSVANLSLKVEQGTLAGIVGPNGAGKTTVCAIVRGFAPRFHTGELEGSVVVGGKKIVDVDLGMLGMDIGFVFQNPFVQISGATDTVFEEVAFGLENLGVGVDRIVERVEETLALLGIEHLRDRCPTELSGGQKQRVAFASTVAMDPPIYVVDEPTSQLDPRSTEEVFEIIATLKAQGKTILLVEHKMELLAEHADAIHVLDRGRLVASGTPSEVFSWSDLTRHGVARPGYAEVEVALAAAGLWDGPIGVTRQHAAAALKSAVLDPGMVAS
jgi:energy-coupling factor transport system ATP-binding protein